MNETELRELMRQVAQKAWVSLARYKFFMFGYHAAQWVMLNHLLPRRSQQPNPWQPLVTIARNVVAHSSGELKIRKVARS